MEYEKWKKMQLTELKESNIRNLKDNIRDGKEKLQGNLASQRVGGNVVLESRARLWSARAAQHSSGNGTDQAITAKPL
jgi:hypothetical protein